MPQMQKMIKNSTLHTFAAFDIQSAVIFSLHEISKLMVKLQTLFCDQKSTSMVADIKFIRLVKLSIAKTQDKASRVIFKILGIY